MNINRQSKDFQAQDYKCANNDKQTQQHALLASTNRAQSEWIKNNKNLRNVTIRESANVPNETVIGLKKISQQIVESLSKALTPNKIVRQSKDVLQDCANKPPSVLEQLIMETEKSRQTKQTEQLQEAENIDGYVNFTKLARKISQEPSKGLSIIRSKMSRQRSQDFNEGQEQWLKQRNEKILKQRVDKQYQEQQSLQVRPKFGKRVGSIDRMQLSYCRRSVDQL